MMEKSVKVDLCESLSKWLHELNPPGPHKSVEELSDGVAMAQALHQIAPEAFNATWLSKIKTDVSHNWRLKMSNLKKLVEGIFDYYVDILNISLTEDARPDVQRLAEHADTVELGRLLQLILGCAVNCNKKQDYITQIMDLEESLQRNIMQALQDLEEIWQGAGVASGRNSMTNVGAAAAATGVETKQVQDERLAQRCHDMEQQIAFHREEKATLQLELLKYQKKLDQYENNVTTLGDDGASLGPVQAGSARYNELRKQLDALKEDLLQAETARDDLKMKSAQQEREIVGLQMRLDDVQATFAELAQLKDEIDVLREASDKLKICEAQLATYKKKLEDHNDLKRQVKLLEERSAEYLRQNLQYEDDQKRQSGWKGQIEAYKREIDELHLRLDTEMSKTVKVEFELSNVTAQLTSLKREKENLLIERDALRDTIDELKCTEVTGTDGDNNVSRELISPAMKDRIDMLQAENKALREGQGGQTALAQLLDDSNQRCEKLREQLKTANQKILTLGQGSGVEESAKGDLVMQLRQSLEMNEQRASQVEESQMQVNSLQAKVGQLEQSLSHREAELLAADTRYRKCVEKAKEVIKTLDPKMATDANLLESGPRDSEEAMPRSGMSVMEERLITTAFYRLSQNCQREAVDSRLALLSGSGQSFLARQRQPAPRKPMNAYKK